jgi:hypothetical protein
MSAKNLYHDVVLQLLIADGWTITHDPFKLSYGGVNLYVDVGAERPTIGAQRGEEKIAVEVASFLKPSPIRDLEETMGQYGFYAGILARQEADRRLFLAVPRRTFEQIFEEPFGRLALEIFNANLVVFDPKGTGELTWIRRK